MIACPISKDSCEMFPVPNAIYFYCSEGELQGIFKEKKFNFQVASVHVYYEKS